MAATPVRKLLLALTPALAALGLAIGIASRGAGPLATALAHPPRPAVPVRVAPIASTETAAEPNFLDTPNGALRDGAALPASEARRQRLRVTAIALAHTDLAAAIAWAGHQPDATDRQIALLAIAREAARLYPTEALALALALDDEAARRDIIALATGQWAVRDPAAAARWADQLDDESLRLPAFAAIAAAWTERQPAAAARLALASAAPGPAQTDAAVTILTRWAQTEPLGAAAWAVQFPAGDARQRALTALVQSWSQPRLADCDDWLGRLPPGVDRDAAVAAFADRIAFSTPTAAAAWAETITEPTLQQQTLAGVAQAWLARDPIAAREWVATGSLPARVKARLLALGTEFPPGATW